MTSMLKTPNATTRAAMREVRWIHGRFDLPRDLFRDSEAKARARKKRKDTGR